jgi:hypothetical protein
MKSMIYAMMLRHGVTHDDLIIHWEAHEYLSYQGSGSKLKSIPQTTRDKIAKFYQECRRSNIYPNRPRDEEMGFYEMISYEEACKRSKKLAASKSQAEMEPA